MENTDPHVLKQLGMLCTSVCDVGKGAPLFVAWIGKDMTPRAAWSARRGPGCGDGGEAIAMVASLAEIVAVAADNVIADVARRSNVSEDVIRLEYLKMRDAARGNAHRIVEGMG